MPTLTPVDTTTLTGQAKETIDRVLERSGRVPNMVGLMVNSPAALDAYIGFAGALSRSGELPADLQALVGVAVTAELGCDYSLAAVSGIARRSGVAETALSAARGAKADDARTTALLTFAVDLVRARGRLPEARVAALKSLGFSDGQIVDLIATIGLNTFRAYFNLIARPVLDFAPVAAASQPAA